VKSITIHGLDDAVARLLEARSRSEGRSLNRVIKGLLEEALGVRPRDPADRARDFEEFLGAWSAAEAAAFQAATGDFRRVEPGEWKP
jgi:hypothetical protein